MSSDADWPWLASDSFIFLIYLSPPIPTHADLRKGISCRMRQWIREDSRFEIMASATLNLICFRLAGSDSRNEQLLQTLNQSGKLYFSHTKLNGKYTLRFCVGQTTTELHHAERAWSEIRSATNLLDARGHRS
jgi:aromatic-L-amino-acid/L-tryptophan decarboxylase